MYCTSCGSLNSDRSRFCIQCGRPFPSSQVPQPLKPPPRSRWFGVLKWSGIVLGSLIGLLVLLGIVVDAFSEGDENQPPGSARQVPSDPSVTSTETPTPTVPALPTATSVPTPVPVTAGQLSRDKTNNEVMWERKYLEKYALISGKVWSIEDAGEYYDVKLNAEFLTNVVCKIEKSPDSEHGVLRLRKGDNTAVLGKVTDKGVFDIVVDDCIIHEGTGESLVTTGLVQPTRSPTDPVTPEATGTKLPTVTPPLPPTPEPVGGWETFTYEDNLTGQPHAGVKLDAVWSTGTLSWFQEQPAQLILKCQRDFGLNGYVEWPGASFLLGDPFKDGKLRVEYVVDEVSYNSWWDGSGGGSAGIPPEDLEVFLDRIVQVKALGIRFLETDWFDNDEQARFEVSGTPWALNQLPCSIPPLMSTLARSKLSLVRVEVHDGAGSGVVVGTEQGHSLVVTAWHVVESYCDEAGDVCVGVSVVAGGERYHGSLRSFNRQEDLAVLDVEGVLPMATLASAVPPLGTEVLTIGFPQGEHDFQHNEGRIVRHSGCSFESCLATNARAWSGFSGGALINLDGELVGVISEGWTGSFYSNAVSVAAVQALLSQ